MSEGIRLVAMDLDGTLLNDVKEISQVNREAILKAREKGIRIVLCSGRSPLSILRYIRELRLDCPGEYYITSNGACIMDAAIHQPIHECVLPQAAVPYLIEKGREYQRWVNPHVYVGDQFIVERYLPQTARYEQLSGCRCTVVEDLMVYKDVSMLKLLYNSVSSPEDLVRLQKKIEPDLPSDIQMFRSSEFLLEFVNQKAGKWNAVEYIAKKLNIPKEQTLCIGDNENDWSMVHQAGYGAVPRNAVSKLQEAAAYIAQRDNNEGAVAEILEHFIFRNE